MYRLDQLGLGKHLDFNAAGVVSVPIITDHPLLPIINAEVRVYTEGLVLERLMDCTSLPVAISIGTHVEGMWTLNTAECGKQVESLLPSDLPTELRNAYMELPGGMIIVFKLRSFVEKEGLCGYEYNPLARALPDMATNLPKYLGIYIQDGSRIASTMTTVTSAWHVALRLHDIEDHRGSKGDALPEDVLRSIVTAIDSWSYISKADAIEIQQEFNINPEELLSLSKYGTHFPEQALPGMGYQLMRYVIKDIYLHTNPVTHVSNSS